MRVLLGTSVGVVLVLGLACTVPLSDSTGAHQAVNTCVDDRSCGDSARCEGGRCVGTEGEFHTVLLEITAPNTTKAGAYAGMRLLVTERDLDRGGGRLPVALPQPLNLVGTILAPPCIGPAGELVSRDLADGKCPGESTRSNGAENPCAYDFGRTPLRVTLTPVQYWQGLRADPYSVRTTCYQPEQCGAARVEVVVPPGEYDVYVRPEDGQDDAPADEGLCAPVPQTFELSIDPPDDVETPLPVQSFYLSDPEALTVAVSWSEDSSGWTVDMLDPATGRRISNNAALDTPAANEGESVARLEFVSLAGELVGTELIRLLPPEGKVAPTYVMERSAIVGSSGEASIALARPPKPVRVRGQLLAQLSPNSEPSEVVPIRGSIAFVATAIDGLGELTLASFKTAVEADEEGWFDVELLPGEYRLRAVPPAACDDVIACDGAMAVCECPLSAIEDTWLVAADAYQEGKSIQLSWMTRLAGAAKTPWGQAVTGASVQAIAAPEQTDALTTELRDSFLPRVSNGVVDAAGRFELRADPGLYNLAVRPEQSSGFAWLVRPNVPVKPGQRTLNLDGLTLPLPVPYEGELRVPYEAEAKDSYLVLPEAVIRAYVFLGEPLDPAAFLVQVAETRSDAEGRFELLLPDRLERE